MVGGGGEQNKMTDLEKDKDSENCPFINDFNFPKAQLSEFTCMPLCMCFSFQ